MGHRCSLDITGVEYHHLRIPKIDMSYLKHRLSKIETIQARPSSKTALVACSTPIPTFVPVLILGNPSLLSPNCSSVQIGSTGFAPSIPTPALPPLATQSETVGTASSFQTLFIDSPSRAINSSVCPGVGVNLNLSSPTATVGKLIAWT